MKVSIEDELVKKVQHEKQKLNIDPINEVKLLLQGDSQEDARILRGLSDNSEFARIQNIRGKHIELEKLETSFQGSVYTLEQIKSLAVDYKLRFLGTKYFTGAFDVSVAAKIKEFANSTNSPVDEYSLKRRYFILAPEEMFSLQDKQYISKKQMDPAIFFQIDDSHYRLIHKWGSDFTMLRLINGFRWKNFGNYWLFNAFMIMPAISIILTMILGLSFIDNNPIWFSLFILAGSFLISQLFFNMNKTDEGQVIKEFFTTWNYNSNEKIRN